MPKVYPAMPFSLSILDSTIRTFNMYIRQYCFPDDYAEDDTMLVGDTERCIHHNYQRTNNCLQKHTGGGAIELGSWVLSATNEEVLAFIIDILEADKETKWTGYRVTCTTHESSGYPYWTLELFAKHPKSSTKVYTGPNAPNVAGKSEAPSKGDLW